MATLSTKLYFNRRKEPRNPHTGLVSFVYRKKLFTGRLKNYSLSGLFIQADMLFTEGEKVIVTLPVSKDKNHKRKGRIVWKNDEGCGVHLI